MQFRLRFKKGLGFAECEINSTEEFERSLLLKERKLGLRQKIGTQKKAGQSPD